MIEKRKRGRPRGSVVRRFMNAAPVRAQQPQQQGDVARKPLVLAATPDMHVFVRINSLIGSDVTLLPADSFSGAIQKLNSTPFDVVLLDSRIETLSFDKCVEQIRATPARPAVIVFSEEGAPEIESMPDAVANYLRTPTLADQFLGAISACMQAIRPRPAFEMAASTNWPVLVPTSVSSGMQNVMRMMEALRTTPTPLLLLGETGTGKEMLARHFHWRSYGSTEPFVVADARGFQPSVLNTSGTVFVRNLAAINDDAAMQLAHAVATSTGMPRIMASSDPQRWNEAVGKSPALQALTQAGFALLPVPPLRDRTSEILPLANYFLHSFCRQFGRTVLRLSPDAENHLTGHSWTENVRELQNVIYRSVVSADPNTTTITSRDLNTGFKFNPDQIASNALASGWKLEDVEREFLDMLVNRSGLSQDEICDRLGMSRTTLWRKRMRHGIG